MCIDNNMRVNGGRFENLPDFTINCILQQNAVHLSNTEQHLFTQIGTYQQELDNFFHGHKFKIKY